MTAGLRSQRAAGEKLTLAPTAIAGLLGAALLIGGLLGVVAKSELDATATSQAAAQVAAAAGASRLVIERNARIAELATGQAAAQVAAAAGASRLVIERNIRIAELATGQAAAQVVAAAGASRLVIGAEHPDRRAGHWPGGRPGRRSGWSVAAGDRAEHPDRRAGHWPGGRAGRPQRLERRGW